MAGSSQNRKCRNYFSAFVAIHKTGEYLENFTEQGLTSVHNHIKNTVGNLAPCLHQCSQNRRDFNRWCLTCTTWRIELQKYMLVIRQNWQTKKSWCWPNGGKEIAEVFVLPGQSRMNINLKDMSTIFNVWNRCTQFQRPVVNVLEPLKESRNELVHNNINMKLTNAKKKLIFRQIRDVINHPDIMQTLQNHADVLQTIREMEKGNLFENDLKRSLKAIGKQAADIKRIMNAFVLAVADNNRLQNKMLKKMIMNISCMFTVFTACIALTCMWLSRPYFNHQCLLLDPSFIQSALNLKYHMGENITLTSQKGCLPEKSKISHYPQISLMEYIDHHQHFVGREWLTTLIKEKLFDVNNKNRGVILEAGMGYGKSALMKYIICSSDNSSAGMLRNRLVAFHVCSFDALISKQMFSFVFRLINMISSQMPFINDEIKACIDIFDKVMCKSDPYGCLDQCLIIPLKNVPYTGSMPVIIIIDGLDECFDDSRGVNEIFLILQKRLYRFPPWVKFLVSSRYYAKINSLTEDLELIELKDESKDNVNDIDMFRRFMYSNKSTKFLNKNEHLNVSNFLLLSLLKQNNDSRESQSGESFPMSLYMFYEHQFQRYFTPIYEEKFRNAKTILEVIYASFDSQSMDQLRTLLSDVTTMTFKEFNLNCQFLHNFFRKIGNKIHFFHLSFQEWLTSEDNTDFSIDIERGHELHALYTFNQIENGNYEIDIVDLVIHVDLSFRKVMRHRFLNMSKVVVADTERNKKENPLFRLVKRHDSLEATNLLMNYFEDIETQNKDNLTALYIAASLGHVKTFSALITKGSNVSFRTNTYTKIINFEKAFTVSIEHQHWDYGIMDIAAQNGHENIVKYLLKNDKRLFEYPTTRYNSMKLLPIHLACKKGHTEIVKLLHSKYEWMLDWQCLYYSSEIGRTCLVSYILDNGIKDKCCKCESHMNWIEKGQFRVQGQMYRSNISEDQEMSYVLLDDWSNITCESALHIAVRENKVNVVKTLTKKSKQSAYCYDRGGRTPVISALQYGFKDIIEHFLSIGILIGNETCGTIHPFNDSFKLHENELFSIGKYFCENHMSVSHILAKYNHVLLAHTLIWNGLTLNWTIKDSEGCSPIHIAACHGSVEMLKYLLEYHEMQFDDLECLNGWTPLHTAVGCQSPASTEILLMNSTWESNSKILEYMKLAMKTEYISEPARHFENIEKSISKIMLMLITKDSDLDITDDMGRNILHYAIAQGHFKVVLDLFNHYHEKAKNLLKAKDNYKRTPLLYALFQLNPLSQFFYSHQIFGTSSLHLNDDILDRITSKEYTLLLTLDFMIQSNILQIDQNLFLKFVKKQCLHAIAYLMETKNYFLLSDIASLSNIIKYDRHGLQIMTFYLVQIKKVLPILVNDFKIVRSNVLPSCRTCNELIHKYHINAIALNYLQISSLIRLVKFGKFNQIFLEYVFHKSLSHMMRSCYDQDGYNVLERAIQGGSPELVKYLIDIGVKSDVDRVKLIEMALNGLKYRRKDKYTAVIGINDLNVLKISYLEHETILQLFAPNKENANKIKDLSAMLFSLNHKLKIEDLYGLLTMKRTMFDELVSNLIIAYRYEIVRNEMCQASRRQFSIIHRLAFDGLKESIEHAVVYWGPGILNCKNADDFTPLYLSKVYRYDDLTKYIEAQGISLHAPIKSAESYFHFKLVFRYIFSKYEKYIHCVILYHNHFPKSPYKRIKAYNCAKRVLQVIKSKECCKYMMDSFKWRLSFYIELNTWHRLMLKLLEWFGVNINDSNELDFTKWELLKYYAQFYLENVRSTFKTVHKYSVVSDVQLAHLLQIVDAENRTCNYLRISFEKMLLIIKNEIILVNNKPAKREMLLRDVDSMLEDISKNGWSTTDCSEIDVSYITRREGYHYIILVRKLFHVLKLELLGTAIKHAFYVPFSTERVNFRDIVQHIDTLLRLYHKYNYMNVLQTSPFLKESFVYESKNIDALSRYTKGISSMVQFIEWSKNAETLFEQYLARKDAV